MQLMQVLLSLLSCQDESDDIPSDISNVMATSHCQIHKYHNIYQRWQSEAIEEKYIESLDVT